MVALRTVEIFSAGCPACAEVAQLVKELACPSCDVTVLDMNESGVAQRAGVLGIRSVPAVAVNGMLADCGVGRGPDRASLHRAGVGQPT